MLGNRRRDTAPELAVRRLLFARGLRYRVDYRPVLGFRRTADIAFTRARFAIFLDGCFWHGCATHYVAPRQNPDYWRSKVEGNIRRDHETTDRLQREGWVVLRYWEHTSPLAIADDICLRLTNADDARHAG